MTTGTVSTDASISLRLTNTANGGSQASPDVVGLGFGRTTTQQAIVGGTFGDDFLEFFTGGDLTHPKMSIRTIGTLNGVGIGTASPVAPLDVELNTGAPKTNQIIAQFGRNSNSPQIQFNDELLTFGLTTGATMTFVSTAVAQIAGNGDIALMPAGKVDIGTTSPSTTLEVDGTVTATITPNHTGFQMIDGTVNVALFTGTGTGFLGTVTPNPLSITTLRKDRREQ